MIRDSAFPITFATVFAIVYVLSLHFGWALFSYGPAGHEFMWFMRPATSGPSMHWYGFVATSGIVAGLVALIVSYLPGDLGKRLPNYLAWLAPLSGIIVVALLIAVVGD
jgi:hypothetical protein